jgi:hypothetical protein
VDGRVPDEITSVGRILQFPPLDEIPEPLRGGRFAIVEAVYMGDEASGSDLLKPLRDLGPAMDTFAMVPPAGLSELHMDPPQPVPYTGEGQMVGALDGAAIDRFVVAAAGPRVRLAAGLRGDPARRRGALAAATASRRAVHVDADYLTFAVGMVLNDEMYRANRSQLDQVAEALGPYDNGRSYLNFAERRDRPARFYTPAVHRRLREVKRAFDPAICSGEPPDRAGLTSHRPTEGPRGGPFACPGCGQPHPERPAASMSARHGAPRIDRASRPIQEER